LGALQVVADLLGEMRRKGVDQGVGGLAPHVGEPLPGLRVRTEETACGAGT